MRCEGSVARPRRRSLRRAGVFLCVLGLSVAGAEVGARCFLGGRFAPGVLTDVPMKIAVVPDARLGWRCRPRFRIRGVGPSLEHPVFRYTATTNRRGLRDVEHAYGKRDDAFRIVCLGDSIAWGWGVDDGESFADRLEPLLGPGVEVINLGVPGYSTDQSLLALLDEGIRYGPDLVLLCHVLNDAEGNRLAANYGLPKPVLARRGDGWRFEGPARARTPSPWSDAAIRLSAASAILQALARPIRAPGPCAPSRERAFRNAEYHVYSPEEIASLADAVCDETSATFALLSLLRRACDGARAPLVAFAVPHLHDQFLQVPCHPWPAEAREAFERGIPFRTRLTRRLEEAGARIGFRVLSVDEGLLRAVRAGRNLNVGDGHLNADGHATVAEALARGLRPIVEARHGGPLAKVSAERGG